MQKIQLSLNKKEEAGEFSQKSNNSFRLADNLFEIDQNQVNHQNSFTNGQFKYQAKPPSPKKTDRFEKNGPNGTLNDQDFKMLSSEEHPQKQLKQ